MKILFLGQLGIPTRLTPVFDRESRVREIASLLTKSGHEAYVAATPAFCGRHIKKWGKTIVLHYPSFHPENAGGWLYELLSLHALWKLQPAVVHISSWRSAVLVRLAALLSPQSTYIWTISSLPQEKLWLVRMALRWARGVFDAITCPTRTLQYQLLVGFGMKAIYVPDGIISPTLPPIPASEWGLRRGAFAISFVSNEDSLPLLLKAYKQTKSRKKLVICVPTVTAKMARIGRRNQFLLFVEASTPRVMSSLMRQASTAIMIEEGSASFLLSAMDAGLPVVAVNHSLNQEILGTTGLFVQKDNAEALEAVLTSVLFYPRDQKKWGVKAHKRVQAHFTWQRVLEEYLTVYHYPFVRRVPVDSIQAIVPKELLA